MNTIDSAVTNTLMMSFHSDNIILKMFYNTLILGIVAYVSKNMPVITKYILGYIYRNKKSVSIHYTCVNSNNQTDRSFSFSAWMNYYNSQKIKNRNNIKEPYNVRELQGGYNELIGNKGVGPIMVPDMPETYKLNDFIYFTYWTEYRTNNNKAECIHHIRISADAIHKKKMIDFDAELVVKYIKTQNNIYNRTSHIFTASVIKDSFGQRIKWDIKEFDSHRTIDHIWFRKKDAFIQQYQNFLNSKDVYKKRGDPWTFSCMLYGVPGCGKTSLLKSIVNLDKKNGKVSHLFIVPFDCVYNEKLFSQIMFDHPNIGNIPYDQRIYVFEDFDACKHSHIFVKREYIHCITDDDEDGKEEDKEEGDKKYSENNASENERGNNDDWQLSTAHEVDILLQDDLKDDPILRTGNDTERIKDLIKFASKKPLIPRKNKIDKNINEKYTINLADILNILDGIIERTGQRVFWTTNRNVNIFDPALIRPGRIDMMIEFTPCDYDGVVYLLKVYYNSDESDTSKLKKNIIITPAKLKELCRLSHTIEECIELLNAFEMEQPNV